MDFLRKAARQFMIAGVLLAHTTTLLQSRGGQLLYFPGARNSPHWQTGITVRTCPLRSLTARWVHLLAMAL